MIDNTLKKLGSTPLPTLGKGALIKPRRPPLARRELKENFQGEKE